MKQNYSVYVNSPKTVSANAAFATNNFHINKLITKTETIITNAKLYIDIINGKLNYICV